jgi:NAD(P)-dependent dehydrogenase (short-subunit alcohol dehydrogenase family)
MDDLKRVCVLTGASGYLGGEVIQRFSGDYQIVAVHNSNLIDFATQEQIFIDPLAPTQDCSANGRAVYSLRVDLEDPGKISSAITEILAKFGRVDLLINGAAIRRFSDLLAPSSLDDVAQVFSINVFAPLRIAVELAKRHWSLDPASNLAYNRNVINISSTAGLYVYPDLGQGLYGASKAALNHLTYHLANEFWDLGVRVNAIAPDTFPGRVATRSVLDAIWRLDCSEETGQVVELP